ncbi:hypothetical protein EDD21DRAFT_367774 [Dissophora ornata]|nr:hypothetical protein EDD21DRAFT_367774 [Dissophora ornata]
MYKQPSFILSDCLQQEKQRQNSIVERINRADCRLFMLFPVSKRPVLPLVYIDINTKQQLCGNMGHLSPALFSLSRPPLLLQMHKRAGRQAGRCCRCSSVVVVIVDGVAGVSLVIFVAVLLFAGHCCWCNCCHGLDLGLRVHKSQKNVDFFFF